ncbi:MAG: FAD-dependent oxidoreductase, partial [Myxococcota bacterium]
MAEAKVVILGGGPAGVSAAYRLHRQRRGHALVVETKDQFGGNAGSFYSEGQWLDYGSHRLDPRTAPDVLTDLKRLLGADLADRPRRDQLRFGGRWFSFPLQPKDLVLRLDPRFTARAARDIVLRAVTKRPKSATKDTLAAVTESNVGATIANGYFFPYAQKVWGQGADALHGPKSFEWLRNALKPARADRFYYPREGFGQISRAYADAARDAGADLRLNTKVVGLYPAQKGWKIELKTERRVVSIEADYVWSTLPMTVVAGMMKPAPPEAVRRARTQVGHRALLLVYLHLDVPRFHEADAHYFPETDVKMTRLSEPKRYFGASEPRDGTT